ncbi:stellacyanin-like [Eucalyptus grandis]|uniref:stellacyanin-like n=1 Tax=Eucalyptus grandis TaxID=71139 RepID=UPI00192EE5CB|nr:stellacyanin-like [Eucalyptus grandis]
MGRGVGFAGCFVVAMLACLRGAGATEYVVGDSRGWTAPPNITARYYLEWAANKTFAQGDILKFVVNGTHDVAEVSKEVYDTCGNATPISGSDYVLLYSLGGFGNENGQCHFISTVDFDCENGLKMVITITDLNISKSPASSASTTTAGALCMLVLLSTSIITMLMN